MWSINKLLAGTIVLDNPSQLTIGRDILLLYSTLRKIDDCEFEKKKNIHVKKQVDTN